MRTIGRNFRTMAVVLGASVAVASFALYPSRSHADAPGAAAAKIETMKQDRVISLRDASDQVTKAFEQGTGTFDSVDRVNDLLLQAELDAATGPAGRLAVLQKAQTLASNQEAYVTAQAKKGLMPREASFEAQAHLLEVQIKLAEESSK